MRSKSDETPGVPGKSLSAQQAADILGLTLGGVYLALKRGRLVRGKKPAWGALNGVYVTRQSVMAYPARHRVLRRAEARKAQRANAMVSVLLVSQDLSLEAQ